MVVAAFFLFFRRENAIITSIIAGYLLLPEGVGFDPPILPTIDKTFVPAFSTLIMCLLIPEKGTGRIGQKPNADAPVRLLDARPRYQTTEREKGDQYRSYPKYRLNNAPHTNSFYISAEKLLIAALIVGPFITFLQNAEAYFVGPLMLPGLSIYDACSMCLSVMIALLPYIIARRYLREKGSHTVLLAAICVSGALYSLPAIFEIRMSPQLSVWVYGFLNQPFYNTVRGAGYRPTVFLHAGLWLALFMAMSTVSAFALWRKTRRRSWLVGGLWLFSVLLISNSLGALILAVVFLPIVLLTSIRTQFTLAAVAAFIIISYPFLRGSNLVPVDTIVNLASEISVERSRSLEYRIKNEDKLLSHANSKPLAGWGGWGRSRVYNEITGEDLSVTDGSWIIIVGTSGWLGYVGYFGLLTMPIFMYSKRARRLDATNYATSGLCLILAINLIDMILNDTITPVTWLIAGSLAGGYKVTKN